VQDLRSSIRLPLQTSRPYWLPDGQLHETREYLRESPVKLPCVDFAGHQANDTRMEVQSVTLARHVPVRKNAFFRASMDAGS
jgi:hypothetical protein